jgi:hypothetical protein
VIVAAPGRVPAMGKDRPAEEPARRHEYCPSPTNGHPG